MSLPYPERTVVEEARQRILLTGTAAEGGAQHAALVLDLLAACPLR